MSINGSTDEVENREVFDAINMDGTGKIKYSEFIASQLEEDYYSTSLQLEAAFHRQVSHCAGSQVHATACRMPRRPPLAVNLSRGRACRWLPQARL